MSYDMHILLRVEEVCERARLTREQLLSMVAEEIIQPCDTRDQEWRFEPAAAALAARAARLHRDLELDWNAVALALSLLDEVEQLRRENLGLRRRLRRFEEI